MRQCPVCHYQILPGHRVFLLFSAGVAVVGGKSQQLIIQYDDNDGYLVHEGCVLGHFNPAHHGDVYNDFYERVRLQIREEEIESLQREAESRAEEAVREELDGMRQGYLCTECRQDIEDIKNRSARDD